MLLDPISGYWLSPRGVEAAVVALIAAAYTIRWLRHVWTRASIPVAPPEPVNEVPPPEPAEPGGHFVATTPPEPNHPA
jgi:hypothetical protein